MRRIAPIKDITDALKYHKVAEAYYYRNWNFLNINFDFKDIVDFKIIPMSDKALSFISHGYIEHIGKGIKINAEYPYKSYRLGFIEEYQKPIEGDLTTEEGRNWSILRHIQATHEPPEISYRNFENEWEAYFSEEKAEEYGTYMARSYKAWEFLVNHLPFFEKYFITTNIDTQSTLSSYFTPETKETTITEIQSRFKEYNGKKMAILIYLLSKEYKILNIVPNSKTNSRVGFVRLLTGNDKINMQGIDKWLIDGNLSLTVHSHEDYDYQNIKKELEKILQ